MIYAVLQDLVVFLKNLKILTNKLTNLISSMCHQTKWKYRGKQLRAWRTNRTHFDENELKRTKHLSNIGQQTYTEHHYIMSGDPTYAVGVPPTNVAGNAFKYLVQLAIWVQVFVSISMGKRGWSTHRFDSADLLSRYDVDYCKFQ